MPTRQDGVENHDKVYSTVNIWVGLGFNSKEGRDGGLAGKKNTLETPLMQCMTIEPITVLYAPVVQKVDSAIR